MAPVKPERQVLHCPECKGQHVDRGIWSAALHHKHLCEHCKHVWRVEPYTFGIEIAPVEPRYFSDSMRHLVCYPYSVAGLHTMAARLEIKRCWFHAGRLAHYDIPKRRIEEIHGLTEVIGPRQLLAIVKGGFPPDRGF